MTVCRAPLFAELPPTAEFWARFVGDREPEAYPIRAHLLHFLYGAGAVYGAIAVSAVVDLHERHVSLTMLLSTVYSILRSVFGSRIMHRRLLGIESTSREALVFHVGHAIYGLSLGTWLSTGNPIGRSEDDG